MFRPARRITISIEDNALMLGHVAVDDLHAGGGEVVGRLQLISRLAQGAPVSDSEIRRALAAFRAMEGMTLWQKTI